MVGETDTMVRTLCHHITVLSLTSQSGVRLVQVHGGRVRDCDNDSMKQNCVVTDIRQQTTLWYGQGCYVTVHLGFLLMACRSAVREFQNHVIVT